RRSALTPAQLRQRSPDAPLPDTDGQEGERRIGVVERVAPGRNGYAYHAVLHRTDGAVMLASGTFERSPFVNFRWLKAPGESYGRSPGMQALPDLKTANKVVELVLKDASIAVTGIRPSAHG